MATKKFFCILFGILAVVATTDLSAQASDPLAGTWELNLEKSKFSPFPPPKSQTRTYEVTGQQEKMIAKGIDAKGKGLRHRSGLLVLTLVGAMIL